MVHVPEKYILYECRDYFRAIVYAIWAHGPLGLSIGEILKKELVTRAKYFLQLVEGV